MRGRTPEPWVDAACYVIYATGAAVAVGLVSGAASRRWIVWPMVTGTLSVVAAFAGPSVLRRVGQRRDRG